MFPELFISPFSYFEQRVKYPRLRVQLLIVSLVGLAANVWRFQLVQRLGAAGPYVEQILYIYIGVGVIEFILWWLVLSFIMHSIAMVLGDESSYGDLLRLTGFGFWPMIISGAIFSYSWSEATAGLDPPEPGRNTGFQENLDAYTDFIAPAYDEPILLAGVSVGALFVLASGYLWVRAVQVATDLSEPRAAVAAGIPVLILMIRIFQPVLSATSESPLAA